VRGLKNGLYWPKLKLGLPGPKPTTVQSPARFNLRHKALTAFTSSSYADWKARTPAHPFDNMLRVSEPLYVVASCNTIKKVHS